MGIYKYRIKRVLKGYNENFEYDTIMSYLNKLSLKKQDSEFIKKFIKVFTYAKQNDSVLYNKMIKEFNKSVKITLKETEVYYMDGNDAPKGPYFDEDVPDKYIGKIRRFDKSLKTEIENNFDLINSKTNQTPEL